MKYSGNQMADNYDRHIRDQDLFPAVIIFECETCEKIYNENGNEVIDIMPYHTIEECECGECLNHPGILRR